MVEGTTGANSVRGGRLAAAAPAARRSNALPNVQPLASAARSQQGAHVPPVSLVQGVAALCRVPHQMCCRACRSHACRNSAHVNGLLRVDRTAVRLCLSATRVGQSAPPWTQAQSTRAWQLMAAFAQSGCLVVTWADSARTGREVSAETGLQLIRRAWSRGCRWNDLRSWRFIGLHQRSDC
jgi:hypothetical protein